MLGIGSHLQHADGRVTADSHVLGHLTRLVTASQSLSEWCLSMLSGRVCSGFDEAAWVCCCSHVTK
jgi:hypothetical protein